MQMSSVSFRAATWRLGVALLALISASPAAADYPVPQPVDPCDCGPIDVVFVVDDTGSMGGPLNAFKSAFPNLLPMINTASNGDYRLGLVTFKDDVTVHAPLGTSAGTVASMVSGLAASGGMGGPEASDEALNTVIHNLPARAGQFGSFSGIWRTGARRFIVLLTDNRPGGFADFYSSTSDAFARQMGWDAWTDEIAIHGIYTGGGSDATVVSVMQAYTNSSRGLFRRTRPDSTDMLQSLQDFLSDCRRPSDAYIKDDSGDFGVEPNTNAITYLSPDMKVCTNGNGCAYPGTNPVYGSGNNYVFVTLRNTGPNVSSGPLGGSLYVYYTASGGSANWPMHWTLINVEHGIYLNPNEVREVRVKWDNVPAPAHYCLMTRWVSQGDPMTFPELIGSLTLQNSQDNNNIAWRNINVSPSVPGGHTGGDVFLHPVDGLAVLDIRLKDTFPGKIRLDLGRELFARWEEAGGKGEGVERIGETTLAVDTGKGGTLFGLPLKDEGESIKVDFEISGDAAPKTHEVLFRQLDKDGKKDFGGVRWDVKVVSYDEPAVAADVDARPVADKGVALAWTHAVQHKWYRVWRLDGSDSTSPKARGAKAGPAGRVIKEIDPVEAGASDVNALTFTDYETTNARYVIESISHAGDSAFSKPLSVGSPGNK